MAISFVVGIIICGSVIAWKQSYADAYVEPKKEIVYEYVYLESEPKIEYVKVPYEEPFYRNFTTEDEWYLKDMAMREAEGQGVIGQCWVMYVMICRAEAFGQSIKQVYESDAFKSSEFRKGKTPNDDCNEAFALIEEGWMPKPLYFRRDHYHNFGTPLCSYGSHYFSTK